MIAMGITSSVLIALIVRYYRRQLRALKLSHNCDLDRIRAQCGALRKSVSAASEAADHRNAEIAALALQNEWLQLQVAALQTQLNSERASARN